MGKFENIMERQPQGKRAYNKYDLSGEYGIGYATNGKKFYFDLEDYNKIRGYRWYVNESDGYVEAIKENNETRHIKLHRLIMDVVDQDWRICQVDHIHGRESRYDNRKSNLRIVTVSQNGMNKGLQSNNTSGVRGVNWDKQRQKWRVRIKINGKEIHLGYFTKLDDAIKVRENAERKYFGEYAYDYSQRINA